MNKGKGIFIFLFFSMFFSPLILYSQIQLGGDLLAESEEDAFGSAVSISTDGSTVAVSGPENDVNGSGYGHVRVYDWINGSWVQRGEDLDGKPGDKLGVSISLSGDGQKIAVGAPFNQEGKPFSGQVRIYTWSSNGEWVMMGQSINGENNGDNAGMSVSLSANGTRVAVGAPNDDSNGNNAGIVKVFEFDALSRSWNQIGSDLLGDQASDKAGYSLDIASNGDYVVVGALGAGSQGKVKVYFWQDNDWIQMGDEIEGETSSIHLGASLSISEKGNRIAVGVPFFPFPGQVRIYDYESGEWELAGQEIDGENSLDKFGFSVSLSADGNRLVVGAPGNSFSGTASVYDYEDQQWTPTGNTVEGDLAGDEFGSAVAIAPDGNRFIVGAPRNDDSGNNSGQAKVFEFTSTSSENLFNKTEWGLYPNPTSGELYIVNVDIEVMEIFNSMGKKIMKNNNAQNSFNISHLPPGMYLVKIHSGSQTGVKKIMKIRDGSN